MSRKLALEIRGLTVSYQGQMAIEDITLDIPRNRVLAFIGPSGCGKSTLLRCFNRMNDLIPGARVEGEVLFHGHDLYAPEVDPVEVRRRIGMVFQSFNLFPHMSVTDNVAIGPRKVLGTAKSTARDNARTMLDRLGLAERADAYPDQLSGGQQQRVAIARSLAMHPEVMLLDEITSALDPELVGEVLDVVRGLRDDGMTMLIATHEMAFAREISDRVCFLHRGQILESGPPERIFENPSQARTREFLQRVIDAGRM